MTPDIEDMTDAQDEAPERIWLKFVAGTITKSRNNKPMDGGTEFVRADLARPSQAGDERVALATKALKRIDELARLVAHDLQGRVEGGKVMGVLQCADVARAALAAMDTPKGGGDVHGG